LDHQEANFVDRDHEKVRFAQQRTRAQRSRTNGEGKHPGLGGRKGRPITNRKTRPTKTGSGRENKNATSKQRRG